MEKVVQIQEEVEWWWWWYNIFTAIKLTYTLE